MLIIKIKCVLITVILLFFSCKPQELQNVQKEQHGENKTNSWEGKTVKVIHTIFPEELFGINFCTIELKDIIKKFQSNNIEFTCRDGNGRVFILQNLEHDIKRLVTVNSKMFIGKELDQKQIVDVGYSDIPSMGWFAFTIAFKIEYYDKVLEMLCEKFGEEKANYNKPNSGEITWYADPDYSIPTCISKVTISKTRLFAEPDMVIQGAGYLEIETRPRHPHDG